MAFPKPPKLRLLCVDDNELVLDSLSRLTARSTDVEIVGTLTSADTLSASAIELKPDVVLLDLEMPGLDAFSAIQRLRQESPHIRVVVLTGVMKPSAIERSLDAGAFGFVTKADGTAEILEAIREAGQGRAPFSPEAKRMSRLASTAPSARPSTVPKPNAPL